MNRAPLLLVLVASTALAQFNYLPFRMQSTVDRKFDVYIDSRMMNLPQPSGQAIALSLARTEIEAAWQTWNDVPGVAPKVRVVGLTGNFPSVVVGSTSDLYSVFPDFVTNHAQSEWSTILGSSTGVSAITVWVAYAGVLRTCDSFFDMADYDFSVDSTLPPTALDVQTVALHEAGHCLGLDHFGNQQLGDIMPFNIVPGQRKTTLGPTDIQALVTRNPSGGGVGAPCLTSGGGDAGCGAGSGIQCVTQPLFGSTDGGTGRYCARGCDVTTGSQCEFPTTCQASSVFAGAGFTGACLWPSTEVTTVGSSCLPGERCGSARGQCLGPRPSPAEPKTWLGGYCTQVCNAPGLPPCPNGSVCTFDPFSQNSICVQECRPGLADCRPEYACDVVDKRTSIYRYGCIPKCLSDDDCADSVNFSCRVCDGICVPKQNVAGQVGDPCVNSSTCGAGQECISIDGTEQKVCSEQCGRFCGTCGANQRCIAAVGGGLWCAQQCSGRGTCGSGTRCAIVGGATVCVPACLDSTVCLAGETCIQGECVGDTGGSGGGDPVVDGGRPVVPPGKKDAGTGGDSGGCGCNSHEGSQGTSLGVGVFFAIAVVALRRRVRGS